LWLPIFHRDRANSRPEPAAIFDDSPPHKGGHGASRAYTWINLPLARRLKGFCPPAEGIQHIALFIGYDNSTPPTLVGGFHHLAEKRAVYRIAGSPLLAYMKPPAARGRPGIMVVDRVIFGGRLFHYRSPFGPMKLGL
jgi:hypothetical protein